MGAETIASQMRSDDTERHTLQEYGFGTGQVLSRASGERAESEAMQGKDEAGYEMQESSQGFGLLPTTLQDVL